MQGIYITQDGEIDTGELMPDGSLRWRGDTYASQSMESWALGEIVIRLAVPSEVARYYQAMARREAMYAARALMSTDWYALAVTNGPLVRRMAEMVVGSGKI